MHAPIRGSSEHRRFETLQMQSPSNEKRRIITIMPMHFDVTLDKILVLSTPHTGTLNMEKSEGVVGYIIFNVNKK